MHWIVSFYQVAVYIVVSWYLVVLLPDYVYAVKTPGLKKAVSITVSSLIACLLLFSLATVAHLVWTGKNLGVALISAVYK